MAKLETTADNSDLHEEILEDIHHHELHEQDILGSHRVTVEVVWEVPVERVELDFDGSRLPDSKIGHVINQSVNIGRSLLGRRTFLLSLFRSCWHACSRILLKIIDFVVFNVYVLRSKGFA